MMPGQPPLPPGHGGIIVRQPWRLSRGKPSWVVSLLTPQLEIVVDRERRQATGPSGTFLIVPDGLRRVQVLISGYGAVVVATADIHVYPGEWRQLTLGQDKYPLPVLDEYGVNVNTLNPPGRRTRILLLGGIIGMMVLAMIFGFSVWVSLAFPDGFWPPW